MKNRDGYNVEVSVIEKVEYSDTGVAITRAGPAWGTFFLHSEELGGMTPDVGDVIITYTQGLSLIRGVAMDGKFFRYVTPKEAEAEHEQFKANNRLKKLEDYIANGDKLKARVKGLPQPLRLRMERFASEGGVEFWIDSAPYEMYAVEGAAALLRKVAELGFIASVDHPAREDTTLAIEWIEDWWALNTKEHDYDYELQQRLVPDFGDGHSGFTAGAAKSLAVAILNGEQV